MAKKLTKKQNIKNWKSGNDKKAISVNEQTKMRKGLILT